MKNLVLIAILVLAFTGPAQAKTVTGTASWYSSEDACGPKTNNKPGCPTASGKSIYRLEKKKVRFIAMNRHEFGDVVKITNLENGKWTEAYVLDRGGFHKYNRVADLSRLVYREIGGGRSGLLRVRIEKIR